LAANINVKGVALGLLTHNEAKEALDLLHFCSIIIFACLTLCVIIMIIIIIVVVIFI